MVESLTVRNDFAARNSDQYSCWSSRYRGPEYYYGFDAGTVARRAVRYHYPPQGVKPTALDIGCGEGQDLAFLSQSGYEATGIDFVPEAIEKAERLLKERRLQASLNVCDLYRWNWTQQYNLVLAVNSLQFLGEDASRFLELARDSVAVGGVLGLSLFGCESGLEVRDDLFFIALEELLKKFDCESSGRSWQMLETSSLWQWNVQANAPQPFTTLIAHRLK